MKKTIYILITIVTLISCEKNNDNNNNTIKQILTIGSETNFIIYQTYITCGFYEATSNDIDDATYYFDIDNDGNNDIMFYGYKQYRHGPASYVSKIECLNENLSVAVNVFTDTVFYYEKIINSQGYDKVISKLFKYYNCQASSENDSIYEIKTNYVIKTFNHNDTINNENIEWINSILKFRHYNYPFGFALPAVVSETPDTAYYEGSAYFDNCRNLPVEQEIIFAIRLKNTIDNKCKYAWFKIILKENNYQINIIEYAISEWI